MTLKSRGRSRENLFAKYCNIIGNLLGRAVAPDENKGFGFNDPIAYILMMPWLLEIAIFLDVDFDPTGIMTFSHNLYEGGPYAWNYPSR